jgi:ribosomal protein L3 glutamine methyltransferase
MHKKSKISKNFTRSSQCNAANKLANIPIIGWINWVQHRFAKANLYFGHGTDNALDEAVYLVLGTLKVPFDCSPKILQKNLNKTQSQKLLRLVELRIEKKIPVAYLLKEAWFANIPFHVNRHVMIPRSSIAELIEQEFQPWIDKKRIKNILDIGTGSGCIAIACAKKFPQSRVDATDISKAALSVAKINVKKHHLKTRVTLSHANLFPLRRNKYDIIVSNPPYVGKNEFANLPAEYYHEPKTAFDGFGDDGLEIVTKIIMQAKNHLTKHGILIVEVGNSDEALLRKFPNLPFIWPDFANGDSGIFILTAKDLHACT